MAAKRKAAVRPMGGSGAAFPRACLQIAWVCADAALLERQAARPAQSRTIPIGFMERRSVDRAQCVLAITCPPPATPWRRRPPHARRHGARPSETTAGQSRGYLMFLVESMID